MTTYFGKSCSFRKLPSIYVFSYFPFGFEGRMWDLIVSVLDHCLSFYFASVTSKITDYLLFTVDCRQHIYRIFVIYSRLSPANLPNICY